jgi:hypothetical protein
MNGSAMGAIAGSMTKTIAHANLPAVTLTANNKTGLVTAAYDFAAVTTNSQLNFSDNVGAGGSIGKSATGNTGYYYIQADNWNARNYNHSHTFDLPSHTHTIPDHNHTVPLGGSGTPLDTTPKSISVNKFVFLGA